MERYFYLAQTGMYVLRVIYFFELFQLRSVPLPLEKSMTSFAAYQFCRAKFSGLLLSLSPSTLFQFESHKRTVVYTSRYLPRL